MKLSWSLETRENDAIYQIFGTHWEHSVTSRKWKVECWVDNRSRILYFRKNMISWFGNSFSSCIYSSANMKKRKKMKKRTVLNRSRPPRTRMWYLSSVSLSQVSSTARQTWTRRQTVLLRNKQFQRVHILGDFKIFEQKGELSNVYPGTSWRNWLDGDINKIAEIFLFAEVGGRG